MIWTWNDFENQLFSNSTLLLQFSKFTVKKYFSGVSYLFSNERWIKSVLRKRAQSETKDKEVADLFRDTVFDP